MKKPVKAVCLYGHHEIGYPRNITVRQCMERAGWRVFLCHSRAPFPLRHLILTLKYLRIQHKVSLIWITESGHRLVPLAKFLALCTGKKIIFDPFLSRYNTKIEDRKRYVVKIFQAVICFWQDWSSTHAADFLIFDTAVHQGYFYKKYRLRKPFAVYPVGVNEKIFIPHKNRPKTANSRFDVLFYGHFIPLQGVEYIVYAAWELRNNTVIKFSLIGSGQTFSEIEKKVNALKMPNLVLQPKVPEEQLPEFISRADVCLGIFGTTSKTDMVVPNKVVQSAAMGKAIITGKTEAIQLYFRDNEDILLAAPGDSRELAQKIFHIAQNPDLKTMLETNARKRFEEHFSITALGKIMDNILNRNSCYSAFLRQARGGPLR